MNRFQLTVLIILCQLQLHSQQSPTGSISGMVKEKGKTGYLIGVMVGIKGSSMGTITDGEGAFILSGLVPGEYDLHLSYIGYESIELKKILVEDGRTTILGSIHLRESPITLREVVISPGQYSIMGTSPLSKQTLASEDLKNISFAEDITRAVTRLPGVASNDFSSKFTIRGGEADEVLITVDGMELYEPFHQRDFSGGLFSIVDIETIKHVDLITGGFAADYGNRQSGVFNLNTKDPSDDTRSTSIGLSVMNARVYTDGNFANNRFKYFFSARRGMLDQIFKAVGEDESIPTFYDMMGKLSYQINDKHQLSLHALFAWDKTAIRDIATEAHDIHDTRYSNGYTWLTWRASFSSKFYARTLLYVGSITHNRNGDAAKDEYSDKLNFKLMDDRSYSFFGFKQDWNWDVGTNFIVKAGYDLRQLSASYDYAYELSDTRIDPNDSLIAFNDSQNIQVDPSGFLTSAYLSLKYKVLNGLFMESGIRHDYGSYSADNLISPRVSLTYSFSDRTFLRAAWGWYYQIQFINNLDVNHGNTTFNEAELSKHYVLGLEHGFLNGLSLRVEAYYKDISNLSPAFQNLRDPWEVFPESRNDVVRLIYDGASAKGIEFFLKYDLGKKISWWASYSLADASETIKTIDFEGLLTPQTGSLPRINNQRHTIYLDMNYRPNPKWYFNLSWQFYQGIPLTLYDYKIKQTNNFNGSSLPLHFYPVHSVFRGSEYPAYHRMDLRVNRKFEVKKGKINGFIHLVNLYNRENQRKFDLDATNDHDEPSVDMNGNYVPIRDDATWFGFLPVLGMSWDF